MPFDAGEARKAFEDNTKNTTNNNNNTSNKSIRFEQRLKALCDILEKSSEFNQSDFLKNLKNHAKAPKADSAEAVKNLIAKQISLLEQQFKKQINKQQNPNYADQQLWIFLNQISKNFGTHFERPESDYASLEKAKNEIPRHDDYTGGTRKNLPAIFNSEILWKVMHSFYKEIRNPDPNNRKDLLIESLTQWYLQKFTGNRQPPDAAVKEIIALKVDEFLEQLESANAENDDRKEAGLLQQDYALEFLYQKAFQKATQIANEKANELQSSNLEQRQKIFKETFNKEIPKQFVNSYYDYYLHHPQNKVLIGHITSEATNQFQRDNRRDHINDYYDLALMRLDLFVKERKQALEFLIKNKNELEKIYNVAKSSADKDDNLNEGLETSGDKNDNLNEGMETSNDKNDNFYEELEKHILKIKPEDTTFTRYQLDFIICNFIKSKDPSYSTNFAGNVRSYSVMMANDNLRNTNNSYNNNNNINNHDNYDFLNYNYRRNNNSSSSNSNSNSNNNNNNNSSTNSNNNNKLREPPSLKPSLKK